MSVLGKRRGVKKIGGLRKWKSAGGLRNWIFERRQNGGGLSLGGLSFDFGKWRRLTTDRRGVKYSFTGVNAPFWSKVIEIGGGLSNVHKAETVLNPPPFRSKVTEIGGVK